MSLFLLRDTYSRNTPPWRSEWWSSLPPDCFISRGSISPCEYILTKVFVTGRRCSHLANPQTGGPPLVGCPRLLIQYIRSYPPYRRPFLHPQPEDAPCRGDRDPLITDRKGISVVKPTDCFDSRGSIWPCEYFLTKVFQGEALLAPRLTPKLEDHLSSAVRDCLFNLFAATHLIGGRSSVRNLRTRHAVVTRIHLSG